MWSRIMPCRDVPFSDNSVVAASGGSASPSSPLAPSMSGSSSHKGVFGPIAKITSDGKIGYSSGSSVIIELANLNKLKERYTEESLQEFEVVYTIGNLDVDSLMHLYNQPTSQKVHFSAIFL